MKTAAALMAASLAAVLAGCSIPAGNPGAAAGEPSPGVPVTLRSGDLVVTATLTDTPEARHLAAMLPVTVELRDVWGQAKSGRLPHPLAAAGTAPTHDPVPGDIYLWPVSDVVAVYYDDLGQQVPDPGLIRIGVVSSGLAD